MKLQALKTFSAGGASLVYEGEQFEANEKHAKEYIRLGLASENLSQAPQVLSEEYQAAITEQPREIAQTNYTQDDLQEKNVTELKKIAKNIGVSSYSGMTKSELIFAILAKQNSNQEKMEG